MLRLDLKTAQDDFVDVRPDVVTYVPRSRRAVAHDLDEDLRERLARVRRTPHEELVQDPTTVLSGIASFLRLDTSHLDTMLSYHQHVDEPVSEYHNRIDQPVSDAPVEGYSNFSFVLLAAGALAAGLDPIVTLKIAGLLGLLGPLAALWLICRRWLSPVGAMIAPILLATYKCTIFWSTSGL